MRLEQILDKSAQYLPNPQGLVITEPASQGDKILVRQLNTIILLLIELHKRVDDIEKNLAERSDTVISGLIDIHRTVNVLRIPIDLDKVIDQIKSIPSGRKPFAKSNKFFRVEGSVDPAERIKGKNQA